MARIKSWFVSSSVCISGKHVYSSMKLTAKALVSTRNVSSNCGQSNKEFAIRSPLSFMARKKLCPAFIQMCPAMLPEFCGLLSYTHYHANSLLTITVVGSTQVPHPWTHPNSVLQCWSYDPIAHLVRELGTAGQSTRILNNNAKTQGWQNKSKRREIVSYAAPQANSSCSLLNLFAHCGHKGHAKFKGLVTLL